MGAVVAEADIAKRTPPVRWTAERAGRAFGWGGSVTMGSVESTSWTRSSAAAARWAHETVMPIVRNGHTSSAT